MRLPNLRKKQQSKRKRAIHKGRVGRLLTVLVMNKIAAFHLNPKAAWVILNGKAFEVTPRDAQLLLNCYH